MAIGAEPSHSAPTKTPCKDCGHRRWNVEDLTPVLRPQLRVLGNHGWNMDDLTPVLRSYSSTTLLTTEFDWLELESTQSIVGEDLIHSRRNEKEWMSQQTLRKRG